MERSIRLTRYGTGQPVTFNRDDLMRSSRMHSDKGNQNERVIKEWTLIELTTGESLDVVETPEEVQLLWELQTD